MKKIIILPLVTLLAGCSDASLLLKAEEYSLIRLNNIETFNIHTDLQQSYLNEEDIGNMSNYANGTAELSRPNKLTLSFESELTASKYDIYLSKDKEFTSYKKYSANSKSVEVTNLELATEYYWKVVADDDYVSDVSSFKTLDNSIRNIYVSGVTNVRDLGGLLVNNGEKRIRQGAIYRGGELNHSWQSMPKNKINDSGIITMKEELGIKSEIDLRKYHDGENSYITSSVLGRDVNYYLSAMDYTTNAMVVEKEAIRKAIEEIIEVDNLPCYFHCLIGTDRTGIISFLIDALLGKSEREIYQNYMFSNFGNIGGSRQHTSFMDKIGLVYSLEGNNLQEKVNTYLVSIGVKQKQINKFLKYMLIDA